MDRILGKADVSVETTCKISCQIFVAQILISGVIGSKSFNFRASFHHLEDGDSRLHLIRFR